jgi:hypothetical protein
MWMCAPASVQRVQLQDLTATVRGDPVDDVEATERGPSPSLTWIAVVAAAAAGLAACSLVAALYMRHSTLRLRQLQAELDGKHPSSLLLLEVGSGWTSTALAALSPSRRVTPLPQQQEAPRLLPAPPTSPLADDEGERRANVA